MKSSISIGKVKGIRIEINYSWFIIFIIVVWSMAASFFPASYPELGVAAKLLLGVAAAVLLFGSVLLHEISHALVSVIQRIPVKKITLIIFGGMAEMEKEPDEPAKELKIAIAGPVMSLLLYVVFMVAARMMNHYGGPAVLTAIFSYTATVNLILAIFNLIPAFPMDGGRVLRALIWHFSGDLHKATRISSALGRVFGYVLIVYGVFTVLTGNLFNGLWFLFIGWIINQMAQSGYQSMVVSNLFDKIHVREFMNGDVVTVDSRISVRAFAEEYLLRYKYTVFPVMNGENVTGFVSLNTAKSVPNEDMPHTVIASIAVPLSDGLVVSPDETVSEAMKKVLSNGVGRVLVMDGDKLLGLISKTDLLKYLAIYNQLSS